MSTLRTVPAVRVVRWTVTAVIPLVLIAVTLRVADCIGDPACTFSPGALDSAVIAFVGGPLTVAAVWVVPVIARARTAAGPGIWLLSIVAGAMAIVLGVVAGGDGALRVAALAAGPVLVLGGAAGVVEAGQ